MLVVDKVTKSYGDIQVLKNVSFTVEKGEIVGLLGQNGAGKSTLLKILASYHMADSGNVSINGFSIVHDSIKTKALCGYLSENAPLFESMTVYEFLSFFIAAKGCSSKEIALEATGLVNLFKLTEHRNVIIGKLSSGYKQRCALAGALAGDISLLILDEPAKGLDPVQIVELREILKSYSSKLTVLISSHILSEMELLCDRVLILHNGQLMHDMELENKDNEKPVSIRIEVSGENEAIRSLNDHKLIKIISISEISSKLTELLVEMDGVEYKKNKVVLLFDLFVEKSLRLHSLKIEKESLEDTFISITGKTNE